MKILILNWKDVKNPNAGGAEIIAFEFAKRLVKEGHEVIFFSRLFPNATKEEIIDGVNIIRRGNAITVYLWAFFNYKSLFIKPERVIDMVNTICWQTPLYVPKKNRIAYVNQLAKEVWFYEKKFPISLLGYLIERFEYLTYKNTTIMCYSQSTKDDLSSYSIPLKNIYLFPMGLDHERYYPGKTKAKNPLFIFVARLVKMKRAELCIQAMKIVVKKYPATKLYIFGNGPDEERLINITQINRLGKYIIFVNKNNFFLKKDKRDVKVKYMQESWAHLLLSVKEGWGMVVTEAAACGTLSIVSNVTGLRDSVLNKKTGFILSKNPSAQELADAMIKVIEDNKLRKGISEEAIKWSNKFTWEKSYQDFKKILLKKV